MKLYLIIASLFILPKFGFANIIQVGPGKSIKQIKTGIQFAKSGDTVFVHPGFYREGNIVIAKKIYLKGIKFPVLDGENKFEILSIKANGSTIDGFKLIHSGVSNLEDYAGIKMYDCRDVTIQNNQLFDTYFGIYLQYGKNCIIRNNTTTAYYKEEQQSGNGIHCWKSDSILIEGNHIVGHRDGIYFEFVMHSTIKGNYSEHNIRYGLHFMYSNDDTYLSNTFFSNGAGVAVMYSHGVHMLRNNFRENWGDAAYGLLLKEISDSYIKGNQFNKNTSGIYMEGVSRVKVLGNNFFNNGWAMKIQASCMEVDIARNNFMGNTFDVGTNGNLVLNRFKNNYWDKYDGYDINKDHVGDIPYRPVSMYSMIVEKNPPAMILFRSFITSLLDKTEKIIPSLTPISLVDNFPLMKMLNQ
ncbi:MAG: nitrous oxide reductase family maturation protein NosD [Chitinophagia bacterium]|jgi:nitrous oxidase accessory protein|nr:nitrous oxide reductase family maturation protein NosD [Chitinophagia bacterium]